MTTCPACGSPRPDAGDVLAATNGTFADAMDLAHAVARDARCPVAVKVAVDGFEVRAR